MLQYNSMFVYYAIRHFLVGLVRTSIIYRLPV
mgnify:CR=1 FL=1